jgi:hypothetical protein
MRGAILPLPQYAFMVWCSVESNKGHVNILLRNNYDKKSYIKAENSDFLFKFIDAVRVDSPCGDRGIRIVPP